MADTERDFAASTTPADASASGARNPHQVVFAAVGGFAWFMAFILWITRAQLVDYTIYDLNDAAALAWWIDTLVFTGIAATVGATVVAAVRHEFRLSHRS